MKPWGIQKTHSSKVKKHIAEHWRTHSDSEIAFVFGVSGAYIAKTRARMGLNKSPAVLRGMKDTIRWVEKTKRSQSQNRSHKRMSDSERFDKAQARKHGRVESDMPMSESEQTALMRSLGYIVE